LHQYFPVELSQVHIGIWNHSVTPKSFDALVHLVEIITAIQRPIRILNILYSYYKIRIVARKV